MVASPDQLTGVRIKIERAEKHISDLNNEITAFFGRGPYEITADDDPETGDYVYRVKIKEDVPAILSGMIGDAVHNLRAALDQLACAAVLANRQQLRRRTGFPIADTQEKFETDAVGKLQSANDKTKRLIRRLKPYKSGCEPLWRIHRLDILDKHRAIIPVGAAHRNVTLNIEMPVPWLDTPVRFPPFAIRPADRQYPLQDGAEVFRIKASSRNSEIKDNPQFTIEVAFGEGQVIESEPVVSSLAQLVEFVKRLVDIFERRIFT